MAGFSHAPVPTDSIGLEAFMKRFQADAKILVSEQNRRSGSESALHASRNTRDNDLRQAAKQISARNVFGG